MEDNIQVSMEPDMLEAVIENNDVKTQGRGFLARGKTVFSEENAGLGKCLGDHIGFVSGGLPASKDRMAVR
jgi:hypothetical protein